jgi:hypothetical protein
MKWMRAFGGLAEFKSFDLFGFGIELAASCQWTMRPLGPVHKLHEHIASHLRAIFDRGSTAKSST